ncbi:MULTISPECIES: alpha/beta hydrolase [unclassified Mycobacterium]|uniref:alpha/beta hydrolase n=1 Tax=unclassified Mycobacterium TaxID=2642494 RepID=UPI00073FB5FE|nr:MULTISPECIES: alpha/beta hydrolase [unclassified Mycobacterium]KUH85573.1 alpha/beta hydrolase [Mycobacterium sp. GA-1999]KUH91431.1 alpha/beta hydrolase [Mycobacterium sp. GA-0227b]KUH96315.1 alpha/beta hydrolase [Mycobacterium sp. IS-1556]
MGTTLVQFDSGGTSCVGQAYLPHAEGRRPCVILCTGFAGTQDTPSLVFTARAFADAGFVAITFDYRSFGSSSGEPRQLVDIVGQLADIRSAIGYARRRPDVDPELVTLWGTSLGGGHVVTVAAEDPRICAVVAQVPFNGFPKKVEQRSTPTTLRLLTAILFDKLRGTLGLAPYYIKVIGTPDEVAVIGSSEAVQATSEIASESWRNLVAPRGLLDMMRYKPGRFAERLQMPVLVCLADFDRETLGADSIELEQRAPRGRVRRYPVSHFGIYRPENRGNVVADQIAFVASVLENTEQKKDS